MKTALKEVMLNKRMCLLSEMYDFLHLRSDQSRPSIVELVSVTVT